MRRANIAVKRERFPIPTIDEVLQDLNHGKIFSKLDIKWAYHQIELEKKSREITTFTNHQGLYRYKRLMFGIACAPEMYQKVLQQLLHDCEGVHNILDDIIVHGRTVEEHNYRVNKVLKVLSEHGLTVNKVKCSFNMTETVFMGHVLSSKGIGPTTVRVKAIVEARPPKDVTEVKSFLGLVTFSARYINNFATITEPLRRLTRKNVNFVWGKEQEKAFKDLKDSLSGAKTLAYFDKNAVTKVVADASPVGIGAVLVQEQNGINKVISYASRSLTDVEKRYSQTEREALGLVWACERFHVYLYGSKFILYTDHKPLQFIYSEKSKPSARIERWVLRLQPYQYVVKYIPGQLNIADALSRLQVPNHKSQQCDEVDYIALVVKEALPVALSVEEVKRDTKCDLELQSIKYYINSGEWRNCKLTKYSCVKEELCTFDDLILRGTRLVIPTSLRRHVLELAHEGHQGIVKTKNRLRSKVWWPNMDKDAEKICRECHGCQIVGSYSLPEPMDRVIPPTGPWQDVAVDIMGPLPSGDNILVIVDYYSRFMEVLVMRKITSLCLINALEPIFMRYGFPFSMKTDNAAYFISEEFTEYLQNCGVEHRTSPPLWPQANGEVERQNRTLLKTLKIARIEKKDWRKEINKFLLAYRTTPHSETGKTPSFMMFNREIRGKLPELKKEKDVYDEDVRDKDWRKKLQEKEYADIKRKAIQTELKIGDTVLLRNSKKCDKLDSLYDTKKYEILTKEGNEVTVKSEGEGSVLRRNSSFVKKYNESEQKGINDNDRGDDDRDDVLPSTTEERRPKRERKPPEWMKDFVI